MENDFLKWSKTVQDSTKTTMDQTSIDHIKKTFCDVLTQTQSILQLDKVYFSKKIIKIIFINIFFFRLSGCLED